MHGDPDRLSTWRKFSVGHCEGCWAGCCRLPVEATPSDLVRLGLISEDEARGSLKKTARRLMKQGYVKYYRARFQRFTLTQTQRGDCLFLDDERRCRVYENRPEVCRRFPHMGPRPGYCPSGR